MVQNKIINPDLENVIAEFRRIRTEYLQNMYFEGPDCVRGNVVNNSTVLYLREVRQKGCSYQGEIEF